MKKREIKYMLKTEAAAASIPDVLEEVKNADVNRYKNPPVLRQKKSIPEIFKITTSIASVTLAVVAFVIMLPVLLDISGSRQTDPGSATQTEKYDVTFVVDGVHYATVGTDGEMPADPLKAGHVFAGWWYVNGEGGWDSVFGSFSEVKSDITLYARWALLLIQDIE